jgi:hypothetical protein
MRRSPDRTTGRTLLLSRAFADLVESNFALGRVGEYAVRL